MSNLVYFSSASNNTHRFIEKLEVDADRIPLHSTEEPLMASEPYVLVTPTYGGGPETKAVPKQVIKFLNVAKNRDLLRGVIAGGNTNFGEAYGIAADIIAKKMNVPVLYKFELFGTPEDVTTVREGLEAFWKR